MKIEEGKFYKTRDGRVAGPMKQRSNCNFPWCGPWDGEGHYTVKDNGRYRLDEIDSPHDLIAECNADGSPLEIDREEQTVAAFRAWRAAGCKVPDGYRMENANKGDASWVKITFPSWSEDCDYRLAPITPEPAGGGDDYAAKPPRFTVSTDPRNIGVLDSERPGMICTSSALSVAQGCASGWNSNPSASDVCDWQPLTRTVPLEAADVLPGSAITFNNGTTWAAVSEVRGPALIAGGCTYTWQRLKDDNAKIFRPGKSGWQHCSKQAPATQP